VPSLQELANNLPNYKYYSGVGNFTQNKLKFGNDKPGNGSSNQPFVVRAIDQRWSPSNFNDGLTRFGIVTTVSRAAADVERISKFLYTTIQGPLFLLKQAGLQRMNPDIEKEDESKRFGPLRTYNPLGINTLAQVGVNAFGLHFVKHGLYPTFSEQNSYEKLVLKRDADNVNRLAILVQKLSNPKQRQNFILRYAGGPKSFYGIGNTTIPRSSYSLLQKSTTNYNGVQDESGFISIPVWNLETLNPVSRDILLDPSRPVEFEGENYNRPVIGPNDVKDYTNNSYQLKSNQDFRKYKNALNSKSDIKGYTLPETNYEYFNLERRIGIARVRKPEERSNYNTNADTADRINAISLFYSKTATGVDINGKQINVADDPSTSIRDIIKFRIKVLDNNVRPDPAGNSAGVYIIFRAYINNIRRGVISKWDPYKYVGRGESFYAYDGVTETITISFTIAASSRMEMKPLYQKLNYLISSLAPDYKDNLMRGNISELTVGDFILFQPGIITNLDMIIDEDSNWEIAINELEQGSDVDMHELPQLIKCTMTFIPIYNFLVRKSSEAPFIGIDGLREPNKPLKQWLKDSSNTLKETSPNPTKVKKAGTVSVPEPQKVNNLQDPDAFVNK